MRPDTLRHLVAAVIAVAVVLPTSALAGMYFNLGFGFGCGGCGRPYAGCLCPPSFRPCAPPCNYGCPPAAPLLPATSYVPQTEIRRQAYIEHVPVTTYEEVTETVYVPQRVTRTIPRTVLTQRTRYRDVAVQTVRPTITHFSPVGPSAGCSSCGSSSIGFAPTTVPGYSDIVPAAAPSVIPSMPAMTVSPYRSPSTVPEYDDVSWRDDGYWRGRYGWRDGYGRYDDYGHYDDYGWDDDDGWRDVPRRSGRRSHHSQTPVRGASMFRPAPTAATVWQSRY